MPLMLIAFNVFNFHKLVQLFMNPQHP